MALMDGSDARLLMIVAVVSAISGTAVQLSTPAVRADAFTASEAKQMERRITLAMKHERAQIELMIERHRIDHPPVATRERIESLEDSARRVDPEYKRPTRNFQAR